MKTREIDGYVCSYALKLFDTDKAAYNMTVRNYSSPHDIKIKLTIEIPDRKIEITESQFDEACDRAREFESLKDIRQIMRMELFGQVE